MTGLQILNVIMARIGTGSGVTSINTELQSVLYDITSRADFYTAIATVETAAGTYEYAEPAGLKRIYESSISGGNLLEKKTYRDYLQAIADGSAAVPGEPLYIARRHGNLYVWPVPDAVYTVDIDHAGFHPETWTDVLLGAEFNEAIFEGVLAALYRGQLFEKLRLNNKKVTARDIAENVTQDKDITTDTDADGTADDRTVTVDDGFVGAVNTDDDTDAMLYEFDKDFPEITKHAAAYEAEIAKLIANMNLDIETILVEYRDI